VHTKTTCDAAFHCTGGPNSNKKKGIFMSNKKDKASTSNGSGKTVTSIWNELLYDMRFGCYKDADKLPPETELAAELGISRTQLRDGLAILEQSGFITRRRRIGTVINRHVTDVRTRIDLEVEFIDMIEQAGYKPHVIHLGVNTVTDNEKVASKLRIALHSPVLSVARLITADDRPAIYCVDYIPYERIKDYNYTLEDLEPPIFYFIEQYCHTSIYMDLTEVSPFTANKEISDLLQVPVGAPVLHLDEVAYNINDEIILYSDEYYADGILNHVVLRKKF
jgi:GntR family transcriptional regulator